LIIKPKKQNLNDSVSKVDPESLDKGFSVVGIGASAGGLEVLKELLVDMPLDTGLAFVVIQHLASGQVSMLTDILSRSTAMPVCKVEEDMKVEANHVYVISPDQNFAIKNNTLKKFPKENQTKIIDAFFTSLAIGKKEQAIGIVLSGIGSDGTEGLKKIKAAGGVTIVQDPKTAQYQDMPLTAISAQAPSFVLPSNLIAKELTHIAKQPQTANQEQKTCEPAKFNSEDYHNAIFAILKEAFEIDFSHYKESTTERRIARRMIINQKKSLKSYVKYLKSTQKEKQMLFDDMLIGVTNFFREPETFKLLESKVFPKLFKATQNGPVRIWVPGCSTGEEVYSIAIAIQEFLEKKNVHSRIQIFGTDINKNNIEKSRKAIYSKKIDAHVSENRRIRYFIKSDGNYRVADFIRDMCHFSVQDVTKDPPFFDVDLICCRNLLIYFDGYMQEKIIPFLYYSLKPNGFLVLGESESVRRFSNLFTPVDSKGSVFVKKS
jgi:two-component system, chemotaxis family, CheB/CheR fusion protein